MGVKTSFGMPTALVCLDWSPGSDPNTSNLLTPTLEVADSREAQVRGPLSLMWETGTQPGPAQAVVGIWVVNQHVHGILLCLSNKLKEAGITSASTLCDKD